MQDCWCFTCCLCRSLGWLSQCSLFCRYYFGRCSSELAQLVHFLILEGGLLLILIDCMIFLPPFLDVTRVSMSIVFFPRTARLWNFLPIEFFSLTYDLSGLKYRIRFFLNRFPVYFNLFVLLFLVTPCLVVAVEPCIKWIPINKKRFLCWKHLGIFRTQFGVYLDSMSWEWF